MLLCFRLLGVWPRLFCGCTLHVYIIKRNVMMVVGQPAAVSENNGETWRRCKIPPLSFAVRPDDDNFECVFLNSTNITNFCVKKCKRRNKYNNKKWSTGRREVQFLQFSETNPGWWIVVADNFQTQLCYKLKITTNPSQKIRYTVYWYVANGSR